MHNAPAPAVTGNRFTCLSPVDRIAPVDGWSLMFYTDEDGDGFTHEEYVARGLRRDVMLPVSRFRFTPTQDRFEWLVRNRFPVKPGEHATGPWDDCDIDYALAAERPAVAA